MVTRSKAALELKRLRERAGYSVRQLAAALKAAGSPYGRSASTFAYYESQFRRPYLPGDLVEGLVPLLEGRGDPPISERQVLALGGPQFNSLWVASGVIGDRTPDRHAAELDAELLAEILTKLSELAAHSGIVLTERQRASLAARIYRQTARLPRAEWAAALDREAAEIAEIGRIFREAPA